MSLIEEYGYIEFKRIDEIWTEYMLEDNTLIKLKIIPIKAIKRGAQIRFNLQKMVAAFSPKDLKGEADSRTYSPEELLESLKNPDMSFKILKDEWSRYKLSDGSIISFREMLNSAASTNKFDSIGDPLYLIQSQTNYKGLPKK